MFLVVSGEPRDTQTNSMGVSETFRKFEGVFHRVSVGFQNVPRTFKGGFQGHSREFQWVPLEFQMCCRGSYGVSGTFQVAPGSFKRYLGIFKRFKGRSR